MSETRMDELVNGLKSISQALSRLVQFKSLYIITMSASLVYLLFNYPTIGISEGIVTAYAILSLFGLVWLDLKDIDLNILNWRARNILGGKLVKSPERTYLIILYSILAAIVTAFIIILLEHPVTNTMMDSAGRMESALQQLFVVTLTESVLFVGIVPLVMMAVLFDRNTASEMSGASWTEWGMVYFLSQSAFAIMHNFAYGGDIFAMVRVFFLGVIWLWLGRHISIGVAWGSHFGFNMAVLGLITLGGI